MTPLEISALAIGFGFLLIVLFNAGHFVFTVFLGRLIGFGIDIRKCGPWAVVTGSTDGIGKAYAKKLASAGLNIVLVSRNAEKLAKVAEEIKACNRNVDVKTIAVDFTEAQSIYPKLKSELENLEIGMLVNNVGMVFGEGQPFHDIADDTIWRDLINCNCVSMVRMCHLILPQMLSRRRGVIVNVGSVSGIFGTPYLTVYGATKAFVDKFSRDLHTEVKSHGIYVQALHPGYVQSNMSRLRRPTFRGPSSEKYVNAAASTLGIESRTAGYWYHKILMYWAEIGYFFFPSMVSRWAMTFIKAYRENTLAKLKTT